MPEPRLLTRYRAEIRPRLKQRLRVDNEFALPRLQKVTLSMGVGKAIDNKKLLDIAVATLTAIFGMNLRHGLETYDVQFGPGILIGVTIVGLILGIFIAGIITRPAAGPSPKATKSRGK